MWIILLLSEGMMDQQLVEKNVKEIEDTRRKKKTRKKPPVEYRKKKKGEKPGKPWPVPVPGPSPTPPKRSPSRKRCPAKCRIWFNGCNTCGCSNGRITFCTRKACPPPPFRQLPICRQYGMFLKNIVDDYVFVSFSFCSDGYDARDCRTIPRRSRGNRIWTTG